MSKIPEESLEKLLRFRREINRVFKYFFDSKKDKDSAGVDNIDVPLDIFEFDDEIFIEMDLPGVAREDIDLSVLRDIIVVEGTKNKENISAPANYHCLERSYGGFRRIIEIPGVGDTHNIKADLNQGVLRISLPKIKDRRGSRRKVQIG
jgi:HSP20 family protein